jgi:hypothetical protein
MHLSHVLYILLYARQSLDNLRLKQNINLKLEVILRGNTTFENGAQMPVVHLRDWFASPPSIHWHRGPPSQLRSQPIQFYTVEDKLN